MKTVIKRPNATPVQHFCSSFDHANLVTFSVVSNIYQKFDSTVAFKDSISQIMWWI